MEFAIGNSEVTSMCRVCLGDGKEHGGLVSLFDCDESRELLKDKYESACGITVTEDEPLPKQICLPCVDRLLAVNAFRRQCETSYNMLRKCIEKPSTTRYHTSPAAAAMPSSTPRRSGGARGGGGGEKKERKKRPPSSAPPVKKVYKYEKTHKCEQCPASFRSNSSLQAHIRRHFGIKPFACKLCDYKCVLNMELRRHMWKHTGHKPYKCRICDRCFSDFGNRQKHERLHVGERPYVCNICGKSFTYSYVLSGHMMTHTGQKKFCCTLCNKGFTKAYQLKNHNDMHHKLPDHMNEPMKNANEETVEAVSSIRQEQIIIAEGITNGGIAVKFHTLDNIIGKVDDKNVCLLTRRTIKQPRKILQASIGQQ